MSLIASCGESLTREVLTALPEGLLSSLAQSLPSTATDTWYGIPSTANTSGSGGGGRFKKGDVVVPKDKQAESDRGDLYEYEKAIVTRVDSTTTNPAGELTGDCHLRRVRDGHTFRGNYFNPSQLALAESSSSSSLSSLSLLHIAVICDCPPPVLSLLLRRFPSLAVATDASNATAAALAMKLKRGEAVLNLLGSHSPPSVTATVEHPVPLLFTHCHSRCRGSRTTPLHTLSPSL